MNDSSKFSENELQSAVYSNEQEAEAILDDERKLHELLGKISNLIDKIKKIPVIGGLVDEVVTMVELVIAYSKGEYKQIPTRVVISAVAAMLYLVSPIDLIPDIIPFAGYIDDAAVLTFVLGTGLSLELSKFRKWREATEREKIIADARAKYFAEYEAFAETKGENDNG